MGLGIYITGEPERSGLLRRRPSSETLFDAIKGAAADLIDDSLTRRFFLSEQGTSELALFLHPAEENVGISYDGRDVTLSAKTSSAGPGYHAWLVNFVEHIGERVGITWDWRDGDEDSADETDYHSHRDFGRLQAAMANWLQEFSKYFLNESDLDSLNICLPLDFSPVHEHFAISPMGVWEREWFECVIRADADEIGDIAQTFFPAWRRSEDALYWRNFGLTMCWMELPWHVPATKHEKAMYQLTVDAFARARELDPTSDLPHAEIAEIESLLEDNDCNRAPRPTGLGFQRGTMRRQLTGGWSVELPGYYYQGNEEDCTTILFWFGDRVMRGSSASYSGDDETLTNLAEVLVRETMAKYEGGGRTAVIEGDDRFGWIYEAEAQDDDTEAPYWNAQALIGSGNNIGLLTVSYSDRERDWGWALEVINTVEYSRSVDDAD